MVMPHCKNNLSKPIEESIPLRTNILVCSLNGFAEEEIKTLKGR
jgi:hypothetical protein